MRKYSLWAFFAILVLYALFQARSLIFGPILIIDTPEAGSTVPVGLIEISGSARNVSSLSLDDRPIYTDKENQFKEELVMQGGINIIKLTGRDRFGREKDLLVRVYAQ